MSELNCLTCYNVEPSITQTRDAHFCTECRTVEGDVVMLQPFHDYNVLVDEQGNLWDYEMVIVGSVLD